MTDHRVERARLFAKLPIVALRKARNEAAAAGNLTLADEAMAALNIRTQSQHEEIAHCGEMFAHHHPPSPENGWRGTTTYTGDPLAWMAPFISGGQVVSFNRDAAVVSRQTVDLKAGERVQVVGQNGAVRNG